MQRWIGPALVGAGAVVFAVGMVGTFGGGTAPATPVPSTTVSASASSTTPEPTTITAPTSTSSTTTQLAPTTSTTTTIAPTTTSAPTTTTTVPDETVEKFIEAFALALEDGDRDFVFARLHPVVIDGWGEELCSAWVDREIMVLSTYTLEGTPDGPAERMISTPAGTVTVADYYTAPVSFVIQGQSFETDSAFALIAPDMYWLGQCR